MLKFHYLKNVATLTLNRDSCIGCGRCLEVCPHQVFAFEGRRAKICEIDACMECGACAKNCPVGVITVNSGVGCASGLLTEWLQEKFSLRVRGGC